MARSSDLEQRICLVWHTEKPYVDKLRKSSNFTLLGSVWNLQMKYSSRSDDYYYTLSLHQGTETEILEESLQFCVSAFMEDKEYEIPLRGFCRKMQSTNEVLFEYPKSTFSKYLSDFENRGELKIICLFHGFPPSVLQTKNETLHLSNQNNLDLHTTVHVLPDLKSLSHDLSSLLKDEVFPDVKLRCGGRTFSAHSCILAARSEVFAAMFRSKMIESETRIIDITDMDADVLELLLKYMYSGTLLDVSEDTARSLYTAGDKYAIQALKKACADWMIKNLTKENCVRFLVVADLHNDVAFKDAIFSFISSMKKN